MRILQIIHCFPPESMTGSEIYAYNLAKELSKNHNVSIFYRISNRKYKDYEVIEGAYNDLAVYKINNTLKRYASLEDIYNNKHIENKFSQVIDKVKPDVVHIHHLLFLSTNIISEIKKRHIPIVFTLHDYWLICPRGQLLKNNLHLCQEPFNSNCLFCIVASLNIKSLFKKISNFSIGFGKSQKRNKDDLRNIYNNVDLFISPSRFLRDRFIKFGIQPEKIVYSNNGLDLSLFKDIEKIRADKIRFGFIGTLIPSKGAHVLIKAFNKIKGDKAVLKIFGKSPVNNGIFGYSLRIKMMTRNNKNIQFMGAFDNNEIARIFKEIDVLVFPSIWEENAPLVLQEAIASKTLVLASNIGGVSELIKHNKNGFLFGPGNVEELLMHIKSIIENPDILDGLKQDISLIKNIRDNAKEMENIYASFKK